jgi:thiamine-monophosphate kinase
MSELALIERIASRTALHPGTALGIGDDAAILDLGGEAVVTHDMLVEGVHFRRETCSASDLGAKAVAVNLSDLAAMGVEAVAVVVGLGLPPGCVASGMADALTAGIEEMASAHTVTVAGGDVTTSPVLVIGVTAIGRPHPGVTPLRRSGGQEGDLLCVTGRLGASAAGLALIEDPLLAPGEPQRRALIGAHLRPEPRLAAGRTLAAGGARAMMDLSDGLLLDAARLGRASGLRARIEAARVPVADGVGAVAAALGREAAVMAATGGEDYELLAAVPPGLLSTLDALLETPLTVVGTLVQGEPGAELRDAEGGIVHVASPGWEHDV